jgi:hypothetical protein
MEKDVLRQVALRVLELGLLEPRDMTESARAALGAWMDEPGGLLVVVRRPGATHVVAVVGVGKVVVQ